MAKLGIVKRRWTKTWNSPRNGDTYETQYALSHTTRREGNLRLVRRFKNVSSGNSWGWNLVENNVAAKEGTIARRLQADGFEEIQA